MSTKDAGKFKENLFPFIEIDLDNPISLFVGFFINRSLHTIVKNKYYPNMTSYKGVDYDLYKKDIKHFIRL